MASPPTNSQIYRWVNTGLNTLSRNLPGVLRTLSDTFPNAVILLLGYPHIFPNTYASPGVPAASMNDCAHLVVHGQPSTVTAFAAQDVHWLNYEEGELNAVLGGHH